MDQWTLEGTKAQWAINTPNGRYGRHARPGGLYVRAFSLGSFARRADIIRRWRCPDPKASADLLYFGLRPNHEPLNPNSTKMEFLRANLPVLSNPDSMNWSRFESPESPLSNVAIVVQFRLATREAQASKFMHIDGIVHIARTSTPYGKTPRPG